MTRWPFLLAFAPVVLEAQGARPLVLGAATARSSTVFSLVTVVRETRSGDVFVADPIERKLFVLPASLKGGRTLGREGSGPGEYRQPDAVWAWPGDSTLVVDLGNGRLSVVGPSGAYGRSIPMAGGASGGPPSVIFPGGTDTQGRIYFAPPVGGGPGSDSGSVMRVGPSGTGAQPVARYKTPDLDRQESGSANQRSVQIRPIPLAAADGWAVSATGDIAVARSGTYRLDWVTNGSVKAGAPVPTTPIRIGDAEKKEWVSQQMLAGGISMQVEEENGRRTMSFGRNRPTQEPSTSGYKWPERKPPFEAGSLRVDAKGRVWVRRNLAAGEPRRYDVFGRDGALMATVSFPAGRALVGFGASSLFAVEIDDDGQYILERYALPI